MFFHSVKTNNERNVINAAVRQLETGRSLTKEWEEAMHLQIPKVLSEGQQAVLYIICEYFYDRENNCS